MIMKQTDRIIDYITRFGSISSWEAYQDLGITQLGARIWELERDGMEFHREMVRGTNRLGDPTHFMRYAFKEAANG